MRDEQTDDILDKRYPIPPAHEKRVFQLIMLSLLFAGGLYLCIMGWRELSRDRGGAGCAAIFAGVLFMVAVTASLLMEHLCRKHGVEKRVEQRWKILTDSELDALDPPPRVAWDKRLLRVAVLVLLFVTTWLTDMGRWAIAGWPESAQWGVGILAIFFLFAKFVDSREVMNANDERIRRRIELLLSTVTGAAREQIKSRGGRPPSITFEQIVAYVEQYRAVHGYDPRLKEIARTYQVSEDRVQARFRERKTTYSKWKTTLE